MMGDDSAGPRGGMRGGMMGGDVNSATSTRVMGVVTAVDGDTITVAGNGAATKVVVNDNTNYTGDDKPAKVNDTIMASGARQSDGTLLASTVRLSRQ
jgi:endonuclease YncB( thermonuclease family)